MQLNLLTRVPAIVNKGPEALIGLTCNVTTYAANGSVLLAYSESLSEASPERVTSLTQKIPWPATSQNHTVLFTILEVFVGRERRARNWYWQSNPSFKDDFSYLGDLRENGPKVRLYLEQVSRIRRSRFRTLVSVNVRVSNPEGGIAFFVRLSLRSSAAEGQDDRVLPVS